MVGFDPSNHGEDGGDVEWTDRIVVSVVGFDHFLFAEKTRTKRLQNKLEERKERKRKKIQINEQLTRVLITLDIFGHQINPLRIDYLAFICFPFN